MSTSNSEMNGLERPSIAIIVGSTRPGRFSEIPAQWLYERLQGREDLAVRLLDLRDYPMPYFDEPTSPANPNREPFESDAVNRWTAAIGASDAFIVVSPEYNHGYSAVLKNALDYVYAEWNRKPIAFVGYGGVSGARAVEQLRLIAIELQMAPIRPALHLPLAVMAARQQGGDPVDELNQLGDRADALVDDLLWWTEALNTARAR